MKLTTFHFDWGDEYYAVSVSPSEIKYVNAYINNQREHHRKKTFEEEYQEFIKSLEIDHNNSAPSRDRYKGYGNSAL